MTLIERILASVESTPAFDQRAVWTFTAMLEALCATLFSDYNSVTDVEVAHLEKHLGADTVMKSIYDISHGSDEQCSVDVLVYRGRPVLLHKKVGDHCDYNDGLSVLDADFVRALMRSLMELRITEKLDAMTATADLTEDTLLDNNQYVLNLGEGLFALSSPKWVLGLQHVFKEHKAFAPTSDGRLVPIESFKQWTNDAPSYSGREASEAVVVTAEGELQLNARDIVFSLCPSPSEEALAECGQSIARDAFWVVSSVNGRTERTREAAQIMQHIAGRVSPVTHVILFAEDGAAEAFRQSIQGMQPGYLTRDSQVLQGLPIDWKFTRLPADNSTQTQ